MNLVVWLLIAAVAFWVSVAVILASGGWLFDRTDRREWDRLAKKDR